MGFRPNSDPSETIFWEIALKGILNFKKYTGQGHFKNEVICLVKVSTSVIRNTLSTFSLTRHTKMAKW